MPESVYLEILKDIVDYIDTTRNSLPNREFLSDYELGALDGREDVLDDIERIINRLK